MSNRVAALPVSYADVDAAANRIAPYVRATPVMRSSALDGLAGARLWFKCENFQRTGAFKVRGAHNAVFALPDETLRAGVITHSSGNHAAALSLAARNRGVAATIIMPQNAPAVKAASVQRLGGRILFCEPTLAAREAAVAEVRAETGACLVHPYDDPLVIAGQGTAAKEFLEECPNLQMMLAPVGGGGLMSGAAIAARALSATIRVVAVEPAQADDAYQSWRSGRLTPGPPPQTIADGLRTTLGANGFAILAPLLDDFVTVSEASIVAAMKLVWETMKIIIEPSSAVPVAAALERRVGGEGLDIGIILSGGNVDLDALPWGSAQG